jgi:hypothetical protein
LVRATVDAPEEVVVVAAARARQRLCERAGFCLRVGPSRVPGAGLGVFVEGSVGPGTVLAFWPGRVYGADDLVLLPVRRPRPRPAVWRECVTDHLQPHGLCSHLVRLQLRTNLRGGCGPRALFVTDERRCGRQDDIAGRYLTSRIDGIVIDATAPAAVGAAAEGPAALAAGGGFAGWAARDAEAGAPSALGAGYVNPLAVAHLVNHPAPQTKPNVLNYPFDFTFEALDSAAPTGTLHTLRSLAPNRAAVEHPAGPPRLAGGQVGFGRIGVSEKEVPNILANLI